MTDICRAAEIERPTFYYHFKDKYELMAWIFFQAAEGTDPPDVESAANGMNEMRKNYVYFKRAYEDKSQNSMRTCIHEYFVVKYSNLAKEKLGVETLDTQTQYSVRLYCYGTLGMTREWLLKDNITPTETIVRMMFNSMPALLQKIYFGVYDCQ